SLLPFAAREAEVAEQCREHQERDHRHGDRGALAKLAAGDAARYDAMFAYLQDFANRLGISVFREPPDLQTLVKNLTT
ncbi:hypothetical protein ABTO85_20095, partial [Acinetobacter baumannii]